jgi:hypothetical protein
MTPMFRRRLLAAAFLLTAPALVGCQTAETGGKSGLGEGEGKAFRERRGWTVDYIAGQAGAPAHCRGRRSAVVAVGSGISISFIGAERESGFRLDGLPAEKTPGKRGEIIALFDNGDRQNFPTRKDGDGLLALAPTAHYEEFMHPFGRARQVSLRDAQGDALGEASLNGSSWAINATDECRRMQQSPRSR